MLDLLCASPEEVKEHLRKELRNRGKEADVLFRAVLSDLTHFQILEPPETDEDWTTLYGMLPFLLKKCSDSVFLCQMMQRLKIRCPFFPAAHDTPFLLESGYRFEDCYMDECCEDYSELCRTVYNDWCFSARQELFTLLGFRSYIYSFFDSCDQTGPESFSESIPPELRNLLAGRMEAYRQTCLEGEYHFLILFAPGFRALQERALSEADAARTLFLQAFSVLKGGDPQEEQTFEEDYEAPSGYYIAEDSVYFYSSCFLSDVYHGPVTVAIQYYAAALACCLLDAYFSLEGRQRL